MDRKPFLPTDQLCNSLIFDPPAGTIVRRAASLDLSDPDSKVEAKTSLPGQARIGLHDPLIYQYLETEFLTPKLNRFAPHLWLVGKQDSKHISSLTYQAVRGRSIVLTENPELHLTWIDNRVFIKPLPMYILSAAFWEYYLMRPTSSIPESSRLAIIRGIKGFLRSYALLIRHKSDFHIAHSPENSSLRILPKGIRYAEFTRFISRFEEIPDEEVSPRYEFGELRVSRLNLWSPLVLHQMNFLKVSHEYGTYFARFFGPLLFVWGCLSVALSAVQVLLAVQPSFTTSTTSTTSTTTPTGAWRSLDQVARGFSAFSFALVVLVVACLFFLLAVLLLRETCFAARDLLKKRARKQGAKASETG